MDAGNGTTNIPFSLSYLKDLIFKDFGDVQLGIPFLWSRNVTAVFFSSWWMLVMAQLGTAVFWYFRTMSSLHI